MNLLGPVGGNTFLYISLGVAALAIGAYIIKMRRRRFEVPFSALWKRVLEQKESNALWKQLKRLLSLLLILLILGIVLFAALDPTLGGSSREARNVVILIDASASMKTLDGDDQGSISRMEAARRRADELIDSMGGGDLAMIMKVDGQATPLSRFSSDGPMLKKIIHGVSTDDVMLPPGPGQKKLGAEAQAQREKTMLLQGIQASDTPADLPRALGAAADALRDRPNPLIVLISDGAFPEQQLGLVSWEAPGAVPPPPDPKLKDKKKSEWDNKNLAHVDLSKIDVRYMPVGKRSDNVGIIAFNVRRYIANKAAYEVYIEIQNFGTEPAHRRLAVKNGGTSVLNNKIELAPGQRIRQILPKLPGTAENELTAQLLPGEGTSNTTDAFPLDDTAYALLPQRKKQKVLMVTKDNLFLEGALLVFDDIDPTKLTPDEYEANPALADKVDVVIFDDYTPKVLPPPPISLLFFHPTGEHSPFAVRGKINKPRITEMDEQHPVMRWVTLSDVYMDESNVFAVDGKKGESAIAYFARDPLIVTKRDGKRKMVAFGFSLPAPDRESATDLPMRVAFPMMLVNTLDWFAGDTTDLLTTYATGKRERIPLDGVIGATEAEVTSRQDGTVTRVPVIDGLATFYASRVGYYDVEAKSLTGASVAKISLAANLASTSESDIAPSSELSLGGKKLEAPEAFAVSTSRKIWIYLLFLAMALIVMEWITYHRRITV